MAALSVFTFQAAINVTAFSFCQAFALPAGSTPTTIVVTAIGPGPAYVAPTTAAASPTGTAASGSTGLTVSAGTGIAVGQLVVATGIVSGTYVFSVSGDNVVMSQPTTAAVSGTVNFVTPISAGAGISVLPYGAVVLAYGSNTFMLAIADRSILNIAVGV